MKIAISNDHAGVELKNAIASHLKSLGHTVIDNGTNSSESVDYPDFTERTAIQVKNHEADLGIVICGTGIGASITANKFKGIRAALCHDIYTAKMAKKHNDANIIALGGRILTPEKAIKIVDSFLSETFDGKRHSRRIAKINNIEERNFLCSD